MSDSVEQPPGPLLATEGARFRESGILGRSAPLIALFDYLLAQSLVGRSPKEVEIALEVFGSEGQHDPSVRVHMHRLRRKVDEFYASRPGPRLYLLKGEYRLQLTLPEAMVDPASEPQADDVAKPSSRDRHFPGWYRILPAAVILLVLLNIVAWLIAARGREPSPEAAARPFWAQLDRSDEQETVIVTGDYYAFADMDGSDQPSRLVLEPPINSKEELNEYLMRHPDAAKSYADIGMRYIPPGVGPALRNIIPVANAVTDWKHRPVVQQISQMPPEKLKSANLIYVGLLSGLGQLRDPLFKVSSLRIGASYDDIIDTKAGKRYQADWFRFLSEQVPRRDYGYIASLSGPTGRRIIVIAGTRDAGLVQASEIASDPIQLAEIERRAGAIGFEALYEVSTVGNLNLRSHLLFARRLRPSLWQPMSKPRFPNTLLPPPDLRN